MTVSQEVERVLEESGRFPRDTEITVEPGDAAGLYTVRLQFPPTVEPDHHSEWVEAVVGEVEDVLELAVTRQVISARGEGVRTEPRGDALHVEGPTGPIVELDIIGVFLEDA